MMDDFSKELLFLGSLLEKIQKNMVAIVLINITISMHLHLLSLVAMESIYFLNITQFSKGDPICIAQKH